MALGANARAAVAATCMTIWSALRESAPFSKAVLSAAINATDDWLDANASTLNDAFPAAFRNNASTAQKAVVLAYTALKRWGG